MHKKRIGDKDYFYTSIRDEKGKVKTIYLGSNKKSALKKEKDLGLNKSNNLLNLHILVLFIALIFLVSLGFFTFTGFESANVSDVLENDSQNSNLLESEEVSVGSFEEMAS